MNVSQALADAAAKGVARLDAQLLLLHALGRSGRDRGWLLAHDTDPLEPGPLQRFGDFCARRLEGVPVAYLVGEKEFHGLRLHVDERVLVPRPDTETLVDWALELLLEKPDGRVVDLGTGSGAIALALKRRAPRALVTGVDSSGAALEVARSNGKNLGLDVSWREGSWLQGVEGTFDLIVSNPPYIAEGDPHLPDLRHEPASALVSGLDGLRDIRAITQQATRHLAPGGWLVFEHGHDQAAAVRELLRAAGLGFVATRRDLAGIERCTGGTSLELG